jgi:hypothetical protein
VQLGLERSWPRTLLKGSVRMSFRSVTIFNEKRIISFPNVQHLFVSVRMNLQLSKAMISDNVLFHYHVQALINSWKVSFFPSNRKNFLPSPTKKNELKIK